MGVPLNLQDIQSGFLSASAHTANNTLIEEALDKALDRTGTVNNAMEADFDMGLYNINNVAEASQDHQAVPFGQLNKTIAASADQVTSTADRDTFTATASQTVFNLINIEYITGTNALIVFVNGVYQISGVDYTETGSQQITFDSGLEAGDTVVVIGARFSAEVFVSESAGFASTAEGFADEAEGWSNQAEQYALDAENAFGNRFEVNDQATNYTLVFGDEGDYVRIENANPSTVTVPAEASVNFPVGSIVVVRQAGEGEVTLVPDSGVTLNAANGELNTAGINYSVGIVKIAADEWDVVKSYAGTQSIDVEELEQSIAAVDSRVDTANTNITTNANDITALQGDVSDIEQDITNLQVDFSGFLEDSDFDSTIAAVDKSNGYQKLPTGLVFQWGHDTSGSSSAKTHTFPTPFDTAAIGIYVSASSDNGNARAVIVDKTSFQTTGIDAGSGTSFNSSVPFYWFAIGI